MNISSYMPIQNKLKIADMSKKKKTIRFSFPRMNKHIFYIYLQLEYESIIKLQYYNRSLKRKKKVPKY